MTATGALARAGIIVSSAFLVSRVLGYVRVVVIANAFPSTELDAFFAAFRIPDLIFQLVAAGALSSALIPIVSALFTTDERARAWRVVSTVINLMLIGLLLFAVALFILAPVVVPIITPGFSGPKLDQTIELTRIMLLSPIFLALGAVATSVLNASGRFAAAAIAPIVYNLAIIGGALILGPEVRGRRPGRGRRRRLARPICSSRSGRWPGSASATTRGSSWRDPQARKALVLMAPRAIGLGVTQITFIVVTSLASLLGDGAVSDFNFAFALLQIPLGIIGVPLGIVLLPSLSRDAAVGHEASFAEPADPGAPAADLRDGPDRRPDRGHPRSRWSRSCSGAAGSVRPTSTSSRSP